MSESTLPLPGQLRLKAVMRGTKLQCEAYYVCVCVGKRSLRLPSRVTRYRRKREALPLAVLFSVVCVFVQTPESWAYRY